MPEQKEFGLYRGATEDSFVSGDKISENAFDEEKLFDQLAKEKTQPLEVLSEKLGVGVAVVKDAIDGLRDKGYGVGVSENQFIRSSVEPPRDKSKIELERDFIFGVISDTHTSSKKERSDALNEMYDIFEREGIRDVFHAGDVTEGYGVYRGQEFELKHFGQQEQVEYTAKEYPKRKGIKTKFITGNHDLRAFERGGIDVGVALATLRPDMIYLGQGYANLVTEDGTEIDLLHPAGSPAYALSYKAQRYINNLAPEDVPEMMIWGHYHCAFYMHYRNVHFLQAPCFKDAGIFEKRLGLNPTVGGWIVEGKIGSAGKIDRFRAELIEFMRSEK